MGAKRLPYFEIFYDDAGEFRVRLKAGNGEIIPDGYSRRRGVQRAIQLMQASAGYAIVDTTWGGPRKATKAKTRTAAE